jgi:hypothetical protein
VFGEGTEGRARWEWVRVLFGTFHPILFFVGSGQGVADGLVEEERLPFQEGFKRSDKMLTISDMLILEEKVNAVPEAESE